MDHMPIPVIRKENESSLLAFHGRHDLGCLESKRPTSSTGNWNWIRIDEQAQDAPRSSC